MIKDLFIKLKELLLGKKQDPFSTAQLKDDLRTAITERDLKFKEADDLEARISALEAQDSRRARSLLEGYKVDLNDLFNILAGMNAEIQQIRKMLRIIVLDQTAIMIKNRMVRMQRLIQIKEAAVATIEMAKEQTREAGETQIEDEAIRGISKVKVQPNTVETSTHTPISTQSYETDVVS